MLTSLDKFDHAAVVGCCARRAEISVALPPNRDNRVDGLIVESVIWPVSVKRGPGREKARCGPGCLSGLNIAAAANNFCGTRS